MTRHGLLQALFHTSFQYLLPDPFGLYNHRVVFNHRVARLYHSSIMNPICLCETLTTP